MQKILKSFTPKFKPTSRAWILLLPACLGGLASLSWYLQKTYVYIPKAQQQIRHIRTLNRLQQEIYPDKGLVESLVQLNQQANTQTNGNFYRISAQATKRAVLNHSVAKYKQSDNSTFKSTSNLTLKNILSAVSILPQSQLAQTNSQTSKQPICQTQIINSSSPDPSSFSDKSLNCISPPSLLD